ncbi:hypothetical protein KAJ87_01910 [Candidatus Pacearchaeota archaeon]|nr:hypothetical protein [Candidatus Pacearchaeota archaeon]
MSLFNGDMIKKRVIAYQGHIGSKDNPNSALEKRLNKLINSGELGVVSYPSLKEKSEHIKFHVESDVYLLYESSPSPYGCNEDLFILNDSGKSSPKYLEKCEQWLKKEFKDFLDERNI